MSAGVNVPPAPTTGAGLHTAKPTPARTGNATLPPGQAGLPLLCQVHTQLDAVVDHDDIQRNDFRRTLHDPLGQTEANGEIRQIGRRRHHDRKGRAAVGQRDRGLLRDAARLWRYRTVAPDQTLNRNNRRRSPRHK
jgi:hypothetical protein